MTSQVGDASPPPASAWISFAHLGVLYTVWSSTYLAIRLAVREGSGFPPFTMSGLRVLAAGGILLAVAILGRRRLKVGRSEAGAIIVSGLLLWVGGNGMVTWAEQRAESGLAALIVGSMPLWVVLLEGIADRRLPSLRLAAALAVGMAGVAVLTWPSLEKGQPADVAAVGALLAAPLLWAAGMVVQRRRLAYVPAWTSAAYQSLAGAAGFGLLILVFAEPRPAPTPEALWAWAYLVVFGSVIAFSSFVQAVRTLPMAVTSTYAYVNPIGAALLGWWILGEAITVHTVVGGALIMAGVAGVFRDKYSKTTDR